MRARTAGALAGLAALAALAALPGCGDEERTTVTRTTPPRTVTSERTVTEERTVTVPGQPRPSGGDRQAVEQAVADLVSASEEGDGRRVCRLTGRPDGAGLAGLRRCAAAVGYAPGTLPTSNEVSFERVRVRGRSASVSLAGGVRIALRKRGRRWLVARVTGA
jgi:hypothetical protein